MMKLQMFIGVMPGLVPGIPMTVATRFRVDRDCRDKPGNDA
jgi:hypothetical protein